MCAAPMLQSTVFGPDRVKEFLRASGLTCIIRAHQCVQDGFEVFASGHLITVFSATNYCEYQSIHVEMNMPISL